MSELVLSVKALRWRDGGEGDREADREFRRVRQEVLKRDGWACRFCGFVSPPNDKGSSWQEVHHLNDDHADNRPENLATICRYCHMAFHVGRAGMDGASVALVPELTQEQVSHLWRALGVAFRFLHKFAERRSPPPYGSLFIDEMRRLHDVLSDVLAALERRRALAREVVGTDSALLLGQALLDAARSAEDVYASRAVWLAGLRLLPPDPREEAKRRGAMFDHWLSPIGPFAGPLRPSTWCRLTEDILQGMARRDV